MSPKQHLEELITLLTSDTATEKQIKGRIIYMHSDVADQPAEAFADSLEPLATLQANDEKQGLYMAIVAGFVATLHAS